MKWLTGFEKFMLAQHLVRRDVREMGIEELQETLETILLCGGSNYRGLMRMKQTELLELALQDLDPPEGISRDEFIDWLRAEGIV